MTEQRVQRGGGAGRRGRKAAAGLAGAAAAGLAALALAGALAGGPARADEGGEAAQGMRIYKAANCVGCHKWDGQGGGGYGGAAANLRQTKLDYDQIVMTVTCGRPGTGMPHFQEDAYSDGHCYGLKEGDIPPDQKVAAPAKWLRGPDIDTVAHYVVDNLKGKGAPTYAECQAFFGTESRVCETYRTGGAGGGSGHLKVEAAPDANTGTTQ